MNYETIITITCLILAVTVIAISFRFAYWRSRAEKAESRCAWWEENRSRIGDREKLLIERLRRSQAILGEAESYLAKYKAAVEKGCAQ